MSALLLAGENSSIGTVQWLLGSGGSEIAEVDQYAGNSVWDLLYDYITQQDPKNFDEWIAEVTALLRVMVLRGAPRPAYLSACLWQEHKCVVQEGARLLRLLP